MNEIHGKGNKENGRVYGSQNAVAEGYGCLPGT